VIEQVLAKKRPEPQLYNVNIPTAALAGDPKVRIVPMDVAHYGERFEKRHDPWGRAYYWATGEPPPRLSERETDLTAIRQGFVTVTPLDYDLTRQTVLEEMRAWKFQLKCEEGCSEEGATAVRVPVVRASRKRRRTE
jgi:5'-nucleotidase